MAGIPNSCKKWDKVLVALGFKCSGSWAKHGLKFTHPTRKPTPPQLPHILLQKDITPSRSRRIISEIKHFGFTEDEISEKY